jgi:hypothetical protein
MNELKKANEIIENGVAEIYRGFFRLREMGEYQEEFNAMGALLNMLIEDRQHLIKKYKVEM